MVYNYKKQRSPIVPMYTILGTSDGVLEKNGGETRVAKQQIRKTEDTPAPNSYNMFGYTYGTCTGTIGARNSTMRTAPQFTFGARLSATKCWEDKPGGDSPGPQYNLQFWSGSRGTYPIMADRIRLPCSNGVPGPQYSLEHVTITRKTSPKYSFGIQHSLPRAPIIVDKPE